MKQTPFKRWLSVILCVVLLAAMALMASGCNDNQTPTDGAAVSVGDVKGEGETAFIFEVTLPDGTAKAYEVRTDKATVGEALLDVGLIAGEDSAYGLYVKTVDGVTLDYDTDGMYWSFYVGGEYAMSGVDTTAVTAGETYAFKAEKA